MKKKVAVIGSGPAALMFAASLDEQKYDVVIYEKKNAPARKFLVAGDGGFNLTHGEDLEKMISRYTPPSFLENCLRSFTNGDLRKWLQQLGIETYTGTSNRVFPVKGIKPIEVLNAILDVLKKKNVQLNTVHEWKGWDEKGRLVFLHQNKRVVTGPDLVVFALGGGSWSKTGSDGQWLNFFKEKNISTLPFRASNCAFQIEWGNVAVHRIEGQPLKNISISISGKESKGEIIITKSGIEGGVVYALSPQIREQMEQNKFAEITIDLKPVFSLSEIKSRLAEKGNYSVSDLLKQKLNLNEVHIALLKGILTKEEFTDPALLAAKIKALLLRISGTAPVEEAISTVGGIAREEVDANFELKKMKGNFAIGEMLDWDAPTGGYLLQACFSMGHYLSEFLDKT